MRGHRTLPGHAVRPSLRALTASTLRDLENGGPTEVDHIVGFMLEKARTHGVDDGMLAVAYTHLKAYEVRRGRNQPR